MLVMFFLFEILPRQNYYTDPSSLSPSLKIIITDFRQDKNYVNWGNDNF